MIQKRLHLSGLPEINLFIGSSIPIASFSAGLLGSPHCIGMCGGLVLSSCDSKKDNVIYQIGRLLSYLGLGLISAIFGHLFSIHQHPIFRYLIPLSIGLFFISLGIIKIWEFSVHPQFLSPLGDLHQFLFKLKSKSTKAPFFIGVLSAFLPCGLLYGVLFSLLSFQGPFIGLISTFTFWLGTLPALLFAPELMRKILTPLQGRSPKIFGCLLIIIGLATIMLKIGVIPHHWMH